MSPTANTALRKARDDVRDVDRPLGLAELALHRLPCHDEGRRIAGRIHLPSSGIATRLSFRISRYGVTRHA